MDLLSQLVETLHVPAQLWAGDGTVLLTNEKFNELLGLPAGFDWRAHELRLLDDPQLQDETLQDCFRRSLNGIAVELHGLSYTPALNAHAATADSGELNFSLTIRPLPVDASSPQCIVCIIGDFMTSARRYEEGLIRGQKMENIEILASGVAHEFNNIFTGIKGMTDLIKYEVDRTSDIYEFAKSIEETIARGAQLIQKLSVFARDMPYSIRRHALGAYLRQAVPLLELQVRRRVQISLDIADDAEVLCDTHRLDQALGHVAVNARDAMGGQGRLRIRSRFAAPPGQTIFSATGQPQWIMVEICDSGPGIPPDLQQRVLEPFFSTKERGKSTGLGLTVAHRIVTAMNGDLSVDNCSDLGGAAIRIFLPVAAQPTSSSVNAESAEPALAL
jgi:signal transduction histidine kinase